MMILPDIVSFIITFKLIELSKLFSKFIGQHALSSDTLSKLRTFTCQVKILILSRKRSVVKIVNEMVDLKLFQLSIDDFYLFHNILTEHTNSVYSAQLQNSLLKSCVRTRGLLPYCILSIIIRYNYQSALLPSTLFVNYSRCVYINRKYFKMTLRTTNSQQYR